MFGVRFPGKVESSYKLASELDFLARVSLYLVLCNGRFLWNLFSFFLTILFSVFLFIGKGRWRNIIGFSIRFLSKKNGAVTKRHQRTKSWSWDLVPQENPLVSRILPPQMESKDFLIQTDWKIETGSEILMKSNAKSSHQAMKDLVKRYSLRHGHHQAALYLQLSKGRLRGR